LCYTASGIITLVGGRPVHRLREDSLNLVWKTNEQRNKVKNSQHYS